MVKTVLHCLWSIWYCHHYHPCYVLPSMFSIPSIAWMNAPQCIPHHQETDREFPEYCAKRQPLCSVLFGSTLPWADFRSGTPESWRENAKWIRSMCRQGQTRGSNSNRRCDWRKIMLEYAQKNQQIVATADITSHKQIASRISRYPILYVLWTTAMAPIISLREIMDLLTKMK